MTWGIDDDIVSHFFDMYKTQFVVGGFPSYDKGLPVMAGLHSYGREFYIGVCRPGIAFLDISRVSGKQRCLSGFSANEAAP